MVTFTHHTDYDHWRDPSRASGVAWKPNALFEDVADLRYTEPYAQFEFKKECNSRFFGAQPVPYALVPKIEEEFDRLHK